MILCASPTVTRFEMLSAVILPVAKFNYIKRHFSLTPFLGRMNHKFDFDRSIHYSNTNPTRPGTKNLCDCSWILFFEICDSL